MSFRKDDSFTPSNNSLDDLVIFKKAVFNKSISCDQSFKSDSRNDSLRSDYKQGKLMSKAPESPFLSVDQNLSESFQSRSPQIYNPRQNQYSFSFDKNYEQRDLSSGFTEIINKADLLQNHTTKSFSYHANKNEFYPVGRQEAQKIHNKTFEYKQFKDIEKKNQLYAPKIKGKKLQDRRPKQEKIFLKYHRQKFSESEAKQINSKQNLESESQRIDDFSEICWDQQQIPEQLEQTIVQDTSISEQIKEIFKQKKIKSKRVEYISKAISRIIKSLIEIGFGLFYQQAQGRAIYQKIEKVWQNPLDLLSKESFMQKINELIQSTIGQELNWELFKQTWSEINANYNDSKDQQLKQLIETVLVFTIKSWLEKYLEVSPNKIERHTLNVFFQIFGLVRQLIFGHSILSIMEVYRAINYQCFDQEFYYSEISKAVIKGLKNWAKVSQSLICPYAVEQADNRLNNEYFEIINTFIEGGK